MTDLRDRAVALYDAYTHEHLDRRRLLREMTLLAGSAVAAEALIGGIGASAASAAVVAPDDKRLVTRMLVGKDRENPSRLYTASLKPGPKGRPIVLVIHENRGLTEHIKDVARRIALAGFNAVAPDLLATQGGTPPDEDRAREMIRGIDYDMTLSLVRVLLRGTGEGYVPGGVKAGAVGFCWGGAFVNRLAAAGPELRAGVSYYGPAPAPAEAAKVSAPLMIHLPGKDARVAATVEPWAAALAEAGKRVELHRYPGADHAFNNDTSAERYDKAAADLAWGRTIAFLRRELDAAG